MKNSDSPLVSVIIPVYNRKNYLAETLESVLTQTHSNLQVVLVDDGSTDGSLEIALGYAKREPKRMTVISQKNAGQVVARNVALRYAKGLYIAFLDSDDLWIRNKLELQLPLFTKKVGLVYSAIETIDEHGQKTGTEMCDPLIRGEAWFELLQSNRMTGGSVVLTRAALDKVGHFDTSFNAAENWDLWIRVARYFHIEYIDIPLVRYRRHHDNMSNDHERMMRAIEMILSKHCGNSDELMSIPGLCDACTAARVAYWYRQGVHAFSHGNYLKARKHFKDVLTRSPGYRDTRVRFLRCFIGHSGNRALSQLASLFHRIS